MTDSFMLDHWGTASRPSLSRQESEAQNPENDDTLTPITNWAHLSYIKNQRHGLRNELKAHQVAEAQAKQSVSSLRRLAFRMVVNISVKEKRIANTARNLASSHGSFYLKEKDTEKRIESLKRALSLEEGKNEQILEALERASSLTLQCTSTDCLSLG